ncbi:hypothetical protein Pcinc_016865 [Petrolisthes cinctipes]|uniref:Peptidyl-prolyl cis-trans isomerase n=1 Tax=Petrolisthes cinctipes TaxID=88211 RepID=A0AAE1KCI6_PETCI|nr:hypothetical protein Pcinc_026296 [Petrolisthes cinctipes]KAK3878522.1 hypothetical protein Pcinc_016865 [Petrolisthes cinctipes]
MSVVIETTIGDITIDLFTDSRPRTCMNFLKLCKMKYYNFHLIFSIERNFIAQTGDPTSSGKGGECINKQMNGDKAKFYEGEKLPIMKHTQLGTVSMVSCGNHLFGSQFFITLGENLDSLDVEHLVFGQVVEGLEVVSKFNQTLTDEKNRPYQDIRITHTVILDDPYPDPEDMVFPAESPRPSLDVLESDYIAADEVIDDTEGKTMTEIQEEIEEKEAKARATILEMVGDLPDSDMAPPENILFVCKLNPVTTSDDLEIIFSRFGKINSCEVIRDRITNNSLQYAFIEFAVTKSCEDAYFKMDNVLIDDRRIHVDFSQSVSKIKWKGKGRGVDYFDEKGEKVEGKRGSLMFNHGMESSRRGGYRGKGRGFGANSNYRNMQPSVHPSQRPFNAPYRNHSPSIRRDQQEDANGHRRGNTDGNSKHNGQKSGKEDQPATSKKKYSELEGLGGKRKYSEVEGISVANDEDREKMLKHLKKSLKKKKKKSKKYSSDSDTDSSLEEKRKKNKKKKKKKVEDSDESSDSDSEKRKKNKKKKKLMESESASDSEPKRKSKKDKKKKKKKRKKRDSFASSSSED